MARVAIELPDRFAFSTEILILVSHINYGGHLDNALLLTLVSEARVRYFAALGYSEKGMNIDGAGIIVADAAVQYKSEAFHGETMIVEIAPQDFHKYGCDLVWRLTDKATGRVVACGKTGVLMLDVKTRKVCRIPERFQRALQGG